MIVIFFITFFVEKKNKKSIAKRAEHTKYCSAHERQNVLRRTTSSVEMKMTMTRTRVRTRTQTQTMLPSTTDTHAHAHKRKPVRVRIQRLSIGVRACVRGEHTKCETVRIRLLRFISRGCCCCYCCFSCFMFVYSLKMRSPSLSLPLSGIRLLSVWKIDSVFGNPGTNGG